MTLASEELGLWLRRQGVQKPVVIPIQQPLVSIYESSFALQHQKAHLLLICLPCLFRPLVNFKNTLHFQMKLITSAGVLPGNSNSFLYFLFLFGSIRWHPTTVFVKYLLGEGKIA